MGKMFYFLAIFKCENCGTISTRVVKVGNRSKFDAREKIGMAHCLSCTSIKALEFFEMQELELTHLEEFMKWSEQYNVP